MICHRTYYVKLIVLSIKTIPRSRPNSFRFAGIMLHFCEGRNIQFIDVI